MSQTAVNQNPVVLENSGGAAMIHRRRCQINLACRYKIASYWYVIKSGKPEFDLISEPKPDRLAMPCCIECKTAIENRMQNANM